MRTLSVDPQSSQAHRVRSMLTPLPRPACRHAAMPPDFRIEHGWFAGLGPAAASPAETPLLSPFLPDFPGDMLIR